MDSELSLWNHVICQKGNSTQTLPNHALQDKDNSELNSGKKP